MGLSMLGSLALMLLLFSTILHLVALMLPAWVQLGVFVPFNPQKGGGGGEGAGRAGGAGGGGERGPGGGGLEGGLEDVISNVTELYSNATTTATTSNASSATTTAAVAMPAVVVVVVKDGEVEDSDDSSDGHPRGGPRVFVKIRLGLWRWCQQFRKVSPTCEDPGFVSGVGVMAVVALFTLPFSFLLLVYASCLQRDCQKKRRVTRLSFFGSIFSGLNLVVAIATYGVLGRREVTAMLLQIGELEESRTFLGWAFGAEGVASLLAFLAALFLGLHLRQTPKATPEFQLVV